jgi:hypothetical protein
MASLPETNQHKQHVNLTLRADLYGIAQGHAKAEGVSVSAFFERILLSMALVEARPVIPGDPDPDMAPLRGILQGPLANLAKRDARAGRHEARVGKGAK